MASAVVTPISPNWRERDRLDALDRFAVLDTPREVEFDDLVTMAAAACNTPISLISLIAERRQWFKAEIGLGMRETTLDMSVCARAVLRPGLVVVPDLHGDDCFAGNPLLSGENGLRFYAGVGLVSSDGFMLGALCVIDRVARPEGLTERQCFTLLALARQVMSQMELRRLIAQRDAFLDRQRQHELVRVQSEEALRRLTRDLELRVQTEVAARQAAQSTLAQTSRMEALGHLAQGLALDFQNVVQATCGTFRLIRKRRTDPAAVERLGRLGVELAGRGASIARRLLAVAGRSELRVTRVDCARLLADLEEVLSFTLGGVPVTIVVPADLPPMLADRAELEMVLIELATNARDAMKEGGAFTLAAACEDVGQSGLGGVPPGRYIRITARDTGAGMDAATLTRAGERFFTTKDRGRGVGLGLAMARGFVEQSGGSLTVASAPGLGTTVSLWFPCAPPEEPPVRVGTGPGSRAMGGRADDRIRRILLVADDEPARRELEAELGEAGFAVRSTASSGAALELLGRDSGVDLLVSDLAMPGMDGITLVRQSRRVRPGLPAILLVSYVGEGAMLAVGGILSGGVILMRKPITGVELGDCAAALLEVAPSRV